MIEQRAVEVEADRIHSRHRASLEVARWSISCPVDSSSIVAIFVTFTAGALTDRIGRRPLYIGGSIAAMLFAFPMYLLTNDAVPALVVLTFIIGIGVIHATLTGTQGSLLTEQIGTSTRTSGASLGYQIAASVGGFAPFIAALMVGLLGWPGASLVVLFAATIGLVGIPATRETRGRAERARALQLSSWKSSPGQRSAAGRSGGPLP